MYSGLKPETKGEKETCLGVVSPDMEPESSKGGTSKLPKGTRVEILVENQSGLTLNLEIIKTELDRLFEKLKETYESEEILDKKILKMTACGECQRFARKMTTKIYFQLKHHTKKLVPVYMDVENLSSSSSDEINDANGSLKKSNSS